MTYIGKQEVQSFADPSNSLTFYPKWTLWVYNNITQFDIFLPRDKTLNSNKFNDRRYLKQLRRFTPHQKFGIHLSVPSNRVNLFYDVTTL